MRLGFTARSGPSDGGQRGQTPLQGGQPPGLSALIPEPACGPSGTGARGPASGTSHQPVLRLAVLEPFPGGHPDLGPDPPDVIGCLDRSMRLWGGVQTYWLTDNERTVSIDHVAGIAVRNPTLVAAASHLWGDRRHLCPL